MTHGDHAGPTAQDSGSTAVQLAVSTVIFALRGGEDDEPRTLWLPLVRRLREPFQGMFALPGGPLSPDQSLEEAARSTLRRATGVVPSYLEQLSTFGRVHRVPPSGDPAESTGTDENPGEASGAPEVRDGVVHPTERVVSVVYWASIHADDAARPRVHENIRWMPAEDLPRLAFDHNEIVEHALTRLRAKLRHSRIGHSFLGEEFTLAQLRDAYEAILGQHIDPANFRRDIAGSRVIVDTGKRLEGTGHRPPRLFRYQPPPG